jgi:hypothetical protein
MSDFKIRPLHRSHNGRRKSVTGLNQDELAELFQVPAAKLKSTLDAMKWLYHQDSGEAIWARPPHQTR